MTVSPCKEPLVCSLVKFLPQQIDEINFLRFHFNLPDCLPDVDQPGRKFPDRIPKRPDKSVRHLYLAVQVAHICPDSLFLKRCYSRTHMNSRDLVDSLSFVGFHADAFLTACTLQIFVLQDLPVMPPDLCFPAFIPVDCCHFAGFKLSVRSADPVSVLIKQVFLVCFGSPLPIFIQRPNGQQDMEVRVVIWRIRIMDGEVCNHPFRYKLFLAVFLRERDVVFHGKFLRQCDLHPPGKLRVPVFLRGLHGIPESFPVSEFRRSMRREQDLFHDEFFFRAVVHVPPIPFTVKFLPGLVGGCVHCGLSFSPLDDVDLHVRTRHISSLLSDRK